MNILQRWKQTSIANKSLVISGFLMAFGTLFYAAAASLQVWIMHRSAKDAAVQTDKIIHAAQAQACAAQKIADASDRNARAADKFATAARDQADRMKELATEAGRQADIARDAVAVNRESAEKDQRPWVLVPAGSEKFIPLAVGEDVVDTIKIVNIGKTLGKNVTAKFCLRMLPKRDEPDFNYSDHFFACSEQWLGTLFPNEEPREIRVPALTTTIDGKKKTVHAQTKDVGSMLDGSTYVVVWGTIWYDDDFHPSGKHWTRYCRSILYGTPLDKTPSKRCVEYNDAD